MQTIQTAFTLGKIALPRTAMLAPMAGVADRAYRLLCRSFGAAATVSEMVSVKGLCYGDKGSAGLCTITEPERPMGLQLFGSEPEFVGKPLRWFSSMPRTGSTSTWDARCTKSLLPAPAAL